MKHFRKKVLILLKFLQFCFIRSYFQPLEVCLGNNSPILTLTCQECGLVKKSAEEMEVHIKVEHINWLPFKCPHCKTHRASDAMMREHIHAAHKQSAKEVRVFLFLCHWLSRHCYCLSLSNFQYIYVDNLEAKRKLQNLLDQSLYATVSKKIGFVEENYESAMSPEVRPLSFLLFNRHSWSFTLKNFCSVELSESKTEVISSIFLGNFEK